MKVIISFILLFVVSISANTVQAKERPKIGLVLSGGGAKGAAHIGVLKVLEQNNIPIDYITGTSIGAYIGGLYALGYSATEIEHIMFGTLWDEGYSDFVPRESLSYLDKQLRDQYNISLRIGYSDGHVKIPSGLLLGQSATQLMQQSTDVVGVFDSFDDLAIPYRAVATDLATAQAVAIKSGSISIAMNASATVPGALEPVIIDGKLLVDGGISNNIPIDIVKAMGADIVIAVDIGSPLLNKKDINSTIDVLNQLSTILTNNTTIKQKKLLGPLDILIRPAIDKLSTTDFSIMPQALVLGEKAAMASLDRIKQFAIEPSDYQQYSQQKYAKSQQWFATFKTPIKLIKFNNNSKVNNIVIEKTFAIKKGDVVTKQQLKEAVARVYALNKFEKVTAEFIDSAKGRTLQLNTEEKSWGPNYFNFGFSFQSDFNANTFVSLDFAYQLTDLNKNGGQWKNEVSIGWETLLATEFYQPLNLSQDYYTRARLAYVRDKWAAAFGRPELTESYYETIAGFGFNYVNNGILELGFIGQKGSLAFDSISNEQLDYQSLGGYLTLGFDSLNSINFPTQGNKFSLNVFVRNDEYDDSLGFTSSDQSVQITLDWRGAIALGKHTFVGITSFASVKNENDFTVHVSELGGFLNLSGYTKDALLGANKAFAAVVYQYDLGREVAGDSGLPLYLGTSIEAGNIWSINENIDFSDLITSGSVYLGTDTSFGPAALGVGFASDGEKAFFLSIGKNW